MVSTLIFEPCVAAPTSTQTDLRQAWCEIGPESCPHHYNFHLHTYCSDGRMSPESIVRQATDLGLKGFAITDHHTVEGYRAAACLLSAEGPRLWSGVEITGRLLGCEVHILGYGFDPDAPELQCYLQRQEVAGASAGQVIEALHIAGGLAVLAHPFRYARPAEDLVPAAYDLGINGLEVYYCYKNNDPWTPSPDRTQAAEGLAAEYELYKTCGTDSHGPTILRRL